MEKLTIKMPDDWHVHLRDGDLLSETVSASSKFFKRAVAMPNLVPPVTNLEEALSYEKRILAQRPTNSSFHPILTLYLTDATSTDDIAEARRGGILAAKLYPSGATTNSKSGVSSIKGLFPIFMKMQEVGMILLIHGEVTDAEIDIFDREKLFIERNLSVIVEKFPELKIVFEHITTSEAVNYVLDSTKYIAATITPQHLLLNRNDLLVGGIKPHNYCLPVLKRNTHQESLRNAVKSGSTKFFLGTDSAPHLKGRKESDCGCAGCYTSPFAIELYAKVFEEINALDKLEGFSSINGATFYGLPVNEEEISLIKKPWKVPAQITLSNGEVIIPFYADQTLAWKCESY